jgi:tripartite ATP-independent transporter DctM subunit
MDTNGSATHKSLTNGIACANPVENYPPNLSATLRSLAKRIEGPLFALCKYLNYLAAGLVLFMAFLLIADVGLRHIFNRPIPGTIELEQFMLAIVAFLGLAWGLIKGAHVRVDLFASKFPIGMNLWLQVFFQILSCALYGIIFWQLTLRMIEAAQTGEAGLMTGIPLYFVLALVCLGALLMTLALVTRILTAQADLIDKVHKPVMTSVSAWGAALALGALPALMLGANIQMGRPGAGALFICLMLLLMFLGMPIAFSMGLVGVLGTWYLMALPTALGSVRILAYECVADYFLCVIPFFVLMGMFCFKSSVSRNAYRAAYTWLGNMPGGLAAATVAGCGGFAAICGDSMATAATMGSVALPEMKKYHYDDELATGALAAGGTLGILIPPSVGFIVYGLIAETSVAKLFVAGIIPGILLALSFIAIIVVRCKLNPSYGPVGAKTTWREKLISLQGVWLIGVLFLVVIGGIYTGFTTPTEAGGLGAGGALIIAMISEGGLDRKRFVEALDEGMQTTAMIFAILIGVSILGYFVVVTEIPLVLSSYISGLQVNRYVVFVIILLLYVILGMVMNIIPMIMLTMPIIFPTVMALGFDPIWFGVITVIMMEMGQITPPVGINVYVVAGVAKDVPMGTIFKGVIPFMAAMIFIIILLTVFPKLVMFLPDQMQILQAIGG